MSAIPNLIFSLLLIFAMNLHASEPLIFAGGKGQGVYDLGVHGEVELRLDNTEWRAPSLRFRKYSKSISLDLSPIGSLRKINLYAASLSQDKMGDYVYVLFECKKQKDKKAYVKLKVNGANETIEQAGVLSMC